MRHASALGLSSLALNLPLALIFLWVLGRFPTSKGREHKAFPGCHGGATAFLGFRTLDASLSSGLGGKQMKTLAVGRVIKALPVVDRALGPTSLLCCSLRTRPWGRST